MARTPLREFQREAVRRTEAFNGRALLALDPGLGKSIVALSWMARNHQISYPALVICPAAVKYSWETEAREHAGKHVVICDTRTPPDDNGFGHGAMIYVINYEILKYWVEYFREKKIQTIIIDECQNIANRKTGRTKAMRYLIEGIPHVLALSGTPLLNRPSELWPTLSILCPDRFGGFWEYAQDFCAPQKKHYGWTFNGATNLDVLHQRLKESCLVRYRKADVLHELPDKQRHIVNVELDAEGQREYKKANDDFVVWLTQIDPGKAKRAERATAMVKVGYLLRLVAKHKIKHVAAWARNFLETNPGKKLVLFAYHKQVIQYLSENVYPRHVIIDGSVTGRAREAARAQFQKDASTRLSINQLQAGGVGLNGYTVAQHLGFAELWWRSGDFIQAGDRLHRIGQTDTVHENWLVTRGTIEEKLCKILQSKQGVISSVLDGDEEADELDVFDKLLESYQGQGFSLL